MKPNKQNSFPRWAPMSVWCMQGKFLQDNMHLKVTSAVYGSIECAIRVFFY